MKRMKKIKDKKRKPALLSAACLLCFTTTLKAATCYQSNNTLAMVGVDGDDGRVYAAVKRGHDNKCGCDYFRFKPNNADTDKILSTLLAAKVSGSRVRLDLKDDTDCNSGYRAYVQ